MRITWGIQARARLLGWSNQEKGTVCAYFEENNDRYIDTMR